MNFNYYEDKIIELTKDFKKFELNFKLMELRKEFLSDYDVTYEETLILKALVNKHYVKYLESK